MTEIMLAISCVIVGILAFQKFTNSTYKKKHKAMSAELDALEREHLTERTAIHDSALVDLVDSVNRSREQRKP